MNRRSIKKTSPFRHHSSKQEAVNAALQDVQRRKQLKILSLFGKIEYDPAYDHKRNRTQERG